MSGDDIRYDEFVGWIKGEFKTEEEKSAYQAGVVDGYMKGYLAGEQKGRTKGDYVIGFNDGAPIGEKNIYSEYLESFKELNDLMAVFFERWSIRYELTELEKLALHIVTIGMQDLGCFIDRAEGVINEQTNN